MNAAFIIAMFVTLYISTVTALGSSNMKGFFPKFSSYLNQIGNPEMFLYNKTIKLCRSTFLHLFR